MGLETIGYFLFMQEQEEKHKQDDEETEQEENNNWIIKACFTSAVKQALIAVIGVPLNRAERQDR